MQMCVTDAAQNQCHGFTMTKLTDLSTFQSLCKMFCSNIVSQYSKTNIICTFICTFHDVNYFRWKEEILQMDILVSDYALLEMMVYQIRQWDNIAMNNLY